jgi:hypothetical protein
MMLEMLMLVRVVLFVALAELQALVAAVSQLSVACEI